MAIPFYVITIILLAPILLSLSSPNASVPELNPILYRDLYPTYLHAGILYSHSIRPTLSLPIHSCSHDTAACFYQTIRNPQLNCSSAPPENVSLALVPFLLNAFDESAETFRADIYAATEWSDWRLEFASSDDSAEGTRRATETCFHLDAEQAPEYAGDYFVLGDAEHSYMPGTTNPAALWRPHSFDGLLSVSGPAEVAAEVTMLCSGRVRHTLQASFEFRTDLDMRSYPFDSHLLQMFFFDPAKRPWMKRTTLTRESRPWMSSYFPSWAVKTVEMEVRFIFLVGQTNATEVGGWRARLGEVVPDGLNGTMSKEELDSFVRGLSEEEAAELAADDPPLHEVVVASFEVQRSLIYVSFTQMFPLLLIYLMGGIPYFLAIDSSGTRLTIGITCVLTLTSLTSFMVGEIPHVDYLTFMHILLIGTYFVLFFMLLHVVTVALILKGCFLELSGQLGDDGSLLRSEVYGYLQKRLALMDADTEIYLDDAPSLVSEFRAMPLRDWSVAQVSQYMKMHDHRACGENVVEFNIDGAVLEMLDADELVSLGVKNRFEAHKLIVELRKCRKFRRQQPQGGGSGRDRMQRWRGFWTQKRFRRWIILYKMALTVLDAQLMWIHPVSLVIFVACTYAGTKSSGAS